jgi:hypothetical protein
MRMAEPHASKARSRRFLISAALALLLSACNVVESLKEVQSQADAAAVLLEKDVGTKPLMEWNVRNGTFANLNVVFDGPKVRALSVQDLESRVRKAVSVSFKEQPKQLVVSARWEQ